MSQQTIWILACLASYVVAFAIVLVLRKRRFKETMHRWESDEAERRRLYEQSEQEWRKAMEEK